MAKRMSLLPLSRVYFLMLRNIVLEKSKPELSQMGNRGRAICLFTATICSLRALEQDFAGQIKCIYIDPPYNTGNAFEHYDDGVEHSIWLNLMYYR